MAAAMTDIAAAQPDLPQQDASQATSGTFEDLGVPADLAKGLAEMGYTAPTPVQRQAYAPAVAGKDLVVQSKTGSGKTTAFCLPTAVRMTAGKDRPQALVLCPTRELASQVAAEATRLMRPKGLEVVAVYGGASFVPQVDALKRGAALVVGTPGRIMDQIERGNFKLDGINTVVLDEADEMLSMGFWEDVTKIIRMMPAGRQILLFSATMPEPIERAARTFLRDPVRLSISGDVYSVEGIENFYYLVNEGMPKPRNFLYVLETEKPRSAIVFANTRGESEMLCHYLRRFGYDADVLNGDLPQKDRERVMRRVKSGELTMMVATDLAARGIDISDLSHVFNYDLPDDPEVYIHRVGRTGRIGKKGTAVSLVRGKYEATLNILRKKFNVPLVARLLPPDAEVVKMQSDRMLALLKDDASGVEYGQYRPVAEHMLKSGEGAEMMAFLLRSYYAARRVRGADEGPAPAVDSTTVEARAARDAAPRERPARTKEDRPPREPRAEGSAPPPAVDGPPSALFVGLGSTHNITEEAVRTFVHERGGLALDLVGRIVVKEDFSVVDVPPEQVNALVEKLHNQMLLEQQVRVEPKQRRAPRSDDGGRREGGRPRRSGGGGGGGGRGRGGPRGRS